MHFLLHHSAIPAMMLLDPSPLSFFGLAAYSSLNDLVWSLGFLLHCLRAPMSHFLLGILGPFTFLGHSRPFLILCSHGLLLTPLGFSGPITLSFIFWAYGFSINPLLSLLVLLWACHGPFSISTSYAAHGFATSLFLGSFRLVCFLKAHLFILQAYDPLFLPLGLNGFSIQLLTHSCLCCWASSFYWASQNEHQHLAP